MKKKSVPYYSPSTATHNQMCKIRRDNIATKQHWMLVDAEGDHVTIVAQRLGEKASQEIQIPRKTMRMFAKWFLADQKQIRK